MSPFSVKWTHAPLNSSSDRSLHYCQTRALLGQFIEAKWHQYASLLFPSDNGHAVHSNGTEFHKVRAQTKTQSPSSSQARSRQTFEQSLLAKRWKTWFVSWKLDFVKWNLLSNKFRNNRVGIVFAESCKVWYFNLWYLMRAWFIEIS